MKAEAEIIYNPLSVQNVMSDMTEDSSIQTSMSDPEQSSCPPCTEPHLNTSNVDITLECKTKPEVSVHIVESDQNLANEQSYTSASKSEKYLDEIYQEEVDTDVDTSLPLEVDLDVMLQKPKRVQFVEPILEKNNVLPKRHFQLSKKEALKGSVNRWMGACRDARNENARTLNLDFSKERIQRTHKHCVENLYKAVMLVEKVAEKMSGMEAKTCEYSSCEEISKRLVKKFTEKSKQTLDNISGLTAIIKNLILLNTI